MRKPGFYNISITFVLRGELFWGISDVAIDGYTCPSRSEALVSDGPPTFTIWTGFLICSMLNMSSIIDLPQPTQTSIHASLVKEADQVTRHKNDYSEFKCRGRRCRPFVSQTTWRYRRGISGAQYDSHYIAEWNSKLNLWLCSCQYFAGRQHVWITCHGHWRIMCTVAQNINQSCTLSPGTCWNHRHLGISYGDNRRSQMWTWDMAMLGRLGSGQVYMHGRWSAMMLIPRHMACGRRSEKDFVCQ